MAKRMIKHLLHTYFDEVPNPSAPNGILLQERLGRLGEEVDVTREVDLKRGEELGAYYTAAEAKAIKAGKYTGPDAQAVYAAREGTGPVALIQPAEGEHGDVASMSAEEVAALINPKAFGEDGKALNVDQTVALADETDVDSINKVIDAENLATDNEPRSGVLDALEAKLTAASQQ